MCEEDEDLVRYHFGEMADEERADFEQRLASEPDLADRLATFRRCVADCEQEESTPHGLADRTVDNVLAPCLGSDGRRPCSARSFSLTEAAVLGLVAVALFAIISPALQARRAHARRAECEKNLWQLGQNLIAYSENNGGYFPRIGPQQNAGMFTLPLVEQQLFQSEELSRVLLCPSSQLAEEVAARRVVISIPTREQLLAARDLQEELYRRYMGGAYAYRFGYYDGPQYRHVRNESSARSPLLGDAPSGPKAEFSRAHGACGQNVLFQDGHVAFQVHCWLPMVEDHMFLNKQQRVAAGVDRTDSVLARSEAIPGVLFRVGPENPMAPLK